MSSSTQETTAWPDSLVTRGPTPAALSATRPVHDKRLPRGVVVTASALGALGVITTLALNDADTGRITLRRLSPENVTKALAVDLVVMDYMEAHDEAGRPVSGAHVSGLEAASAAIESVPELSRALESNSITARDYLLTIGAIMYADVVSDLPDLAAADTDFGRVSKANIEFWRSLPPDVKVAAEGWKRRQQRN